MESFDDVVKTPPVRQMFVVASAIPLVLPLLTFVLWFMMQDPVEPSVAPPEFVAVFAPIALASLPLALWIRRASLRRSAPTTPSQWGATLTPEAARMQIITTSAIVGMALPEISLLLGFVLGFFDMAWTYYIPFAIYAVIGWAVMFPRPSQVRAWYAEQMGGDRLPPMNVGGA